MGGWVSKQQSISAQHESWIRHHTFLDGHTEEVCTFPGCCWGSGKQKQLCSVGAYGTSTLYSSKHVGEVIPDVESIDPDSSDTDTAAEVPELLPPAAIPIAGEGDALVIEFEDTESGTVTLEVVTDEEQPVTVGDS